MKHFPRVWRRFHANSIEIHANSIEIEKKNRAWIYFKWPFSIRGKNINNLNTEEVQIFRRNAFKFNCERHFEVFDTYKIIPENLTVYRNVEGSTS